MNFLDQRIKTFASQGLSPYEIEEKLGFKHYTIHIEHHEALMAGYSFDVKSEKKLAAKERKRDYSELMRRTTVRSESTYIRNVMRMTRNIGSAYKRRKKDTEKNTRSSLTQDVEKDIGRKRKRS